MLKKTHRLTKPQFDTYYQKGKKHHFAHLVVVTHPAPTFLGSVVVGKKVSKSAVRRNALRRRVYARLSQLHTELGLSGVYIVILKPGYNSLTRIAANELLTQSIVALEQKA